MTLPSIDLVALLLLAIHVSVVFVATVLISANRRPSAAIAWVLAIIFVPFVGVLAFVLVGVGRLPAGRRRAQAEINELMSSRTPGLSQVSHGPEWPEWLGSAVRMNTALGSLPMVGGNTVDLIDDYTGSLDQMIEAIDRATSHVHVEFYILVLDDRTSAFFTALSRAIERGVRVRVLSDHLAGFLQPRRRETIARLREIGAEWHAMLPLRPLRGQWQRPDLRNHRKLVVVDGLVAFTGSQNLIDSTYLKKSNIDAGRHWHEVMVKIEGPAVREIDAVFVTDWYSETSELLPLDNSPIELERDVDHRHLDVQVVPSGPSFENDNNLKLFVLILQSAQHRISITSPYFVPDESTMLALVTAASRGIDVELFVSAEGDQTLVHHAQRSYYEELLRAGVVIHLYRPPAVLHSKHFSVDSDVAVIGSSNMDIRSFSLNMEISVLVHGRSFVDRLRLIEDEYRRSSDRLHLESWTSRPTLQKAGDNLARLTSALQ